MNKVGLLILAAVLAAACGASANDESERTPQRHAAGDEQAKDSPPNSSQDQESSPLLSRYFEMQQALAADRMDGAKSAASQLAQTAQGEIAQLAGQAAESADIAAMRKAFIALSEKVIEEEGAQGQFKVAVCPMANDNQGARWLQKDGPIRNPYYGSEMLECGYFAEDSE